MNTISILAIFSVCAMMLLAEYSRRYEPEGSHGDTLGSWLFASQRRSGSSLEAAPVVRDAPSAKHSHPLWNPGDCALELLAWADPILDSPAALFDRQKNHRASHRIRDKRGVRCPKRYLALVYTV